MTQQYKTPAAPLIFYQPLRHAATNNVPLNVNMPNGTTIQSSHTCNLLLTDLPPQSPQAYILPGLVHNSLISVGQL
jgi:hypothetical protein